jgi:CheY-like chemotaxis protein
MHPQSDARDLELAGSPKRRRLAKLPLLDVLVVDDDVDAAQLMAALLAAFGHRTTAVHSGLEAIDVALKVVPHVVLLDIGLPGMNGYEAAGLLRRESLLDHTLLVAVTGWGRESDQRAALKAGFDMHLTKPVGPETLREVLAWAQVTCESFRTNGTSGRGHSIA